MNRDFQNVIKYAFFGGPAPEPEDFFALARDFQSHSLSMLLGHSAMSPFLSGMPEKMKKEWDEAFYQQVRKNAMNLSAQRKFHKLLTENGYCPVILKGTSAARYYPNPLFRVTGDIDFLLYGNDDEKTFLQFLRANGYLVYGVSSGKEGRHYTIEKDGALFEYHRHFSAKRNEYDERLDRMLEKEPPEKYMFGKDVFYSFSAAGNGLVFLQHMNHHMINGLGYRQIFDWMCYVNSVLTDEFWEMEFEEKAAEIKLRTLAIHVTRLCEIYFGLPEHGFSKEADETLCRAMAEDIYEAGNFSRNRDEMTEFLYRGRTSGNVFKKLQKKGIASWEAAKKHKILRPFAWLYSAFQALRRFLKNGNVKNIRESQKIAEKNKKIYSALGVGIYRGQGISER